MVVSKRVQLKGKTLPDKKCQVLPGPGEVWGPSEVVDAAEDSVWGSLWLCWLSLLEASKLPVDFFGTSSFSCSV